MNMTSGDTATEIQDTLTSPAIDQKQLRKFNKRLAELNNDPDFIREMQNRKMVQAEFESLKAMDPVKREKLMFTVQCHRMTRWNESVERNRKEQERKALASEMAN